MNPELIELTKTELTRVNGEIEILKEEKKKLKLLLGPSQKRRKNEKKQTRDEKDKGDVIQAQ